MQKPTVGRIVHYTLPDGRNAGQVRPAIIVHVEDESPESLVSLQVFAKGDGGPENDATPHVVLKVDVLQSEEPEAGKFCFPVIHKK